RSEFRRLRDADGAHHVPVQFDLLRSEFFCLSVVDLTVTGVCQKQSGTPCVKFRCAALVRMDMSPFVADHSVKRLAKLGQTSGVCRRTGKHKINIAIDLENFPDASTHLRRPFVLAVSGRILCVGFLQSCPRLRTNRRRVIAGEMVPNAVGAHPGSYYASFSS